MNINSDKDNFDTIYKNEYNKVYQELSNKVLSALKKATGKSILFKKDELISQFTNDFNAMTLKKIGPGNYHEDSYTKRLLDDFSNRLRDYETNKITGFITEHLEKIKDNYKAIEHYVPQNIKLNPVQTVEFIAKYHVMKLMINRIYSIDQNDTIEICEKKISLEGYIVPVIEVEQVNPNKIEWLGTQKELGELFVELFRKGWISSIDDKLISSYFTNSNTISQILKKGKIDKNTKDYLYESIYTSKYSKKFDGIKIKKTNKKVN